jgi:hypothetical protein
MGGHRDVADVAFCFMPGIRHKLMLLVALPPPLKISILDKSYKCIIHGYISVSIDTINHRLDYIFGGGCLPIQKLDNLSFKSTSVFG